LCGKKIYLL